MTEQPTISTDELQQRAQAQIEAIHRAGMNIALITVEEERMVNSFRSFKASLKRDGLTFTWQTRRD